MHLILLTENTLQELLQKGYSHLIFKRADESYTPAVVTFEAVKQAPENTDALLIADNETHNMLSSTRRIYYVQVEDFL